MTAPEFLKNPYSQLLFSLLALILCSPFIARAEGNFPLLSVLFCFIVLSSMRIICQQKSLFVFFGLLAWTAIVLDFLIGFGLLPRYEFWFVIIDVLYIVFTSFTILAIMRRVFSESRVTINTITGSIAVYLLIGILWIFLYYVTAALTHNAFNKEMIGGSLKGPEIFYFSFTTLTTLGYGDVVPTNYFSRVLACVEAICGQIFLTVFVARLVGLHIVHETRQKA
jgi:hypothetical protein